MLIRKFGLYAANQVLKGAPERTSPRARRYDETRLAAGHPTKFLLAINLNPAKSLGLKIRRPFSPAPTR